ncbi:MAG: PAS domain S-box protein [Limisphaerales bacterium]
MKATRLRGVVYLAIPILAGGIFAAGLFTPLGIVNCVWYFIPLLLSVYVGGRVLPFVLAALLSALMMAGHFLAPMGADSRWALESHLMSVCVLWVAAFLISQHKRTVQEMRTLSRAAEQSSVSIVITNPAGNIEYVNRKFTEVTGYSFKEALGKNPRILKSGELPPEAYRQLWEAITAGKEWRGEFHNRKKDGGLYWESASLSPIFDNAGNIAHFLAVKEDITERKRVEQQLEEMLDFNQKIILNAPVGIIVFKTSGQCVLANEAAARILDGTVAQLIKQNFRQLESWRASGMLQVAESVLAADKPQQYETHFISTFGKEVWLVCYFSPFVWGNEPHLLLLISDITARRQAEEHIREQAALLDKAPDAILALDMDDRVIYWNKGAERVYGWTANEATGKKPLELFLNGVISPQHKKAIQTVKEYGEWAGELPEYTKNGKPITVQGRCNLILDEQGRPKSWLIINTDITEKKKFESQILRSQRMESIGSLAGGIAHDLNNILTPLLVSIQVLKENVTDADGSKLLEALEANVQRGAGLVKQVLAFGRGMEGERIAVNPKHIAREIEQIIHETFPKSVAFELHSAPDLWTITGDPTQLHQVLLNLCVNARDAMPGGGQLSLRLENTKVDETYAGMNLEARPGPYVVITVADTGTGIPKEIQERIFDPFFTTKEPGKGTGLGLSTTLAIIKSHGGFINCYSEPAKGTVFRVYFPANTTPMPTEKTGAEQSKLPRGHNELVLVVDDEEPIRQVAQRTLERFGYRVLLAADGAEAVSLYKSRQREIDVVITDMAMPVMDGPATILALKAINPHVKLVSSSGMTADGGLDKVKEIGVRHFIPKPYTAETMLHKLDEVLHETAAN